jgi:hypothetical protein
MDLLLLLSVWHCTLRGDILEEACLSLCTHLPGVLAQQTSAMCSMCAPHYAACTSAEPDLSTALPSAMTSLPLCIHRMTEDGTCEDLRTLLCALSLETGRAACLPGDLGWRPFRREAVEMVGLWAQFWQEDESLLPRDITPGRRSMGGGGGKAFLAREQASYFSEEAGSSVSLLLLLLSLCHAGTTLLFLPVLPSAAGEADMRESAVSLHVRGGLQSYGRERRELLETLAWRTFCTFAFLLLAVAWDGWRPRGGL